MAIDDPLHQAEQQNRDSESGGLLSPLLNLAGLLLGLLTGNAAATAAATSSGVAVVWELIDSKRQTAGASAMIQALVDAHRSANGRLEQIEKKLRGLDAEEAFVKGARAAAMTARLDKARRIGQVLGSTLAQESPNWKEAAEFIGDLEQFGDDDIQAIEILWKVQRKQLRVRIGDELYMESEIRDYLQGWTGVLDRAKVAGIVSDDWLARCGRLTGFGMAIPVQARSPLQGQQGPCYRLSTKAVRLMKLLRIYVDPKEYPKAVYHPDGNSRTVQDEDEHRKLGPQWSERPFQKP